MTPFETGRGVDTVRAKRCQRVRDFERAEMPKRDGRVGAAELPEQNFQGGGGRVAAWPSMHVSDRPEPKADYLLGS